jgi:hypothetical protein
MSFFSLEWRWEERGRGQLLIGLQGILAYSFHPGGFMTELASRLPKHFHCKTRYPLSLYGGLVVSGSERRLISSAFPSPPERRRGTWWRLSRLPYREAAGVACRALHQLQLGPSRVDGHGKADCGAGLAEV